MRLVSSFWGSIGGSDLTDSKVLSYLYFWQHHQIEIASNEEPKLTEMNEFQEIYLPLALNSMSHNNTYGLLSRFLKF